MPTTSTNDPQQVRSYIEDLEIPHLPAALESLDTEAPETPTFHESGSQLLAIGSQLAEFADAVPAAMREQISNSFLIAQLAAEKALSSDGGAREWHEKYREVLLNVGWVEVGSSSSERTVSGDSLKVHEAIVPVIASALGPAAGAALVLTVLNALSEMDEDKPWITLFDQRSRRASANQFQVSYADINATSEPRAVVTSFSLAAEGQVTQILFFSFGQSEATLKHLDSTLAANPAVFAAARGALANKVAEHARRFIKEIEI